MHKTAAELKLNPKTIRTAMIDNLGLKLCNRMLKHLPKEFMNFGKLQENVQVSQTN